MWETEKLISCILLESVASVKNEMIDSPCVNIGNFKNRYLIEQFWGDMRKQADWWTEMYFWRIWLGEKIH